MSYSKEAMYDDQGTFFWSLCKTAGKTREDIEKIMLSKYKKTHWNILEENERKQMIAIVKKYAKQKQSSELIRKIMGLWSKNGHNIEELHALMTEWGLGNSLRACRVQTLYSILKSVQKICANKKNAQCEI